MRDRRGIIIYVGKAKNLRRRVSSYFRPGAKHAPKVRSMVDTVYDFEFMTVKNEAESLLTEATLIKRYKPHFNILMRDDKRYLALRADPAAAWPRFTCCRIVRDDGARYFGPFPSAPVVRTAKDFVEKRYGIRECACLEPDAEAHRHCLANVIRHCSAPCLGKISEADYRARFEEACAFLEGKRPETMAEVGAEMRGTSAAGNFEKAARLRDTLFALQEMTKAHFVRKSPEMRRTDALQGLEELAEVIGLTAPPHTIECLDISNLFGTHSVASLVVAREGLPDKRFYRHFKIKTVVGADDPRSMAEVVRRRFTDPDIRLTRPDLIVCDGGVTQLRATRAVLAEFGLSDIPSVGLAERQEEIVVDDGRPNLFLPRDSQGLFVLTRLRDEAHRFAITYHRHLREKSIRESVLDEIPGIGEAKKMKLLKTFRSVYGIARASAADIAATAGVSEAIAAEVCRVVRTLACLVMAAAFAFRASASDWASRLNESFAIDSAQCIIGANDLGLVNGHVTMNGRIEDVAEIRGLYAPPYFCGNFRLALLFDGQTVAANHYAWRPECLTREGVRGDWKISTRLLPLAGSRTSVLAVSLENAGRTPADVSLQMCVFGTVGRQEAWGFHKPTGDTVWRDGVLTLGNTRPARIAAGWTLGASDKAELKAVSPGEKRIFCLAFTIGAPEEVVSEVRAALADPSAAIESAVRAWHTRVERLAACMPQFDCDSMAWVRLYERSLLHLLLAEWNVDAFLLHPYYATGGMNGGCICNYLWNFGGPYRLWPLLDPEALKAHLKTFLKLDLETCYAFAPSDGSPQGPYYPINQEKIILLIDAYVRETGDVAFLNETFEGRTFAAWVEKMALTHDDLTKPAVLADYGPGGETHLELRRGRALYDGVMPDLNLRRIAMLDKAASLCRMAGYRTKVDLRERARALKHLVRDELWNERAGWFRVRCSDGQSKLRWTVQMFKALGSGRAVLDEDVEAALVAHLMNPREFLGQYGLHSLSKLDEFYDENDVDNGGPGACPSFGPAICDRLYRDGRFREANEILSRFLWLGDSLPYWGDSQYADRRDYRRDTPLQCDIEGACFAQTIIFGLFGIRIDDRLNVTSDPHLPKGVHRMSLTGLRLCGRTYDF